MPITERGELVIGSLTTRGELAIGALTATGRLVFPTSETPPVEPPIVTGTPSGGGGGGPRRPILQRAIVVARLYLYAAAYDRLTAREWAIVYLRRATVSAAQGSACDRSVSRLSYGAGSSEQSQARAAAPARWTTTRASVGQSAGRDSAIVAVTFHTHGGARHQGVARAGLLLLSARACMDRGAMHETSAGRLLLAQTGRTRAALLARTTMHLLARIGVDEDDE